MNINKSRIKQVNCMFQSKSLVDGLSFSFSFVLTNYKSSYNHYFSFIGKNIFIRVLTFSNILFFYIDYRLSFAKRFSDIKQCWDVLGITYQLYPNSIPMNPIFIPSNT